MQRRKSTPKHATGIEFSHMPLQLPFIVFFLFIFVCIAFESIVVRGSPDTFQPFLELICLCDVFTFSISCGELPLYNRAFDKIDSKKSQVVKRFDTQMEQFNVRGWPYLACVLSS